MNWTCEDFDTEAFGKPAVFPYEDWERRTRRKLAKADQGKHLWQPLIVALIPDGDDDQNPSYANAVACIEQLVENHKVVISKDTLRALTQLKAPEDYELSPEDAAILSHMVLYVQECDARKEPELPSQTKSDEARRAYNTLHIGTAVPRESLQNASSEDIKIRTGIDVDLTQVLTAVIDDTMGIANQRFRASKDNTRIEHFWSQGLESFQIHTTGTEAIIGREYRKADIDVVLRQRKSETKFYEILYKTKERRIVLRIMELVYRIEVLNDDNPKTKAELEGLIEEVLDFLDDLLKKSDANAASLSSLQFQPRIDLIFANLVEPLTSAPNFLFRDYVSPMGQLGAHGTAVLDLAAGEDPTKAHTQARPIVAVELPDLATLETSGARLEAYVLQAVQRILHWADNFGEDGDSGEAGRRLPVVINFSYGVTAGPKDGSGVLEREIQRLVDHRNQSVPTVAVLPAGNSYRSLLNGFVDLGRNEKRFVEWKIPPEDFSPSYLEIRVPADAAWTLTLTPPNSAEIKKTNGDFTDRFWLYSGGKQGVSKAIYVSDEPRTNTKLITIALAPTTTFEEPRDRTEPGIYGVTLENLGQDPMFVRYDVQRDDTPIGYPPFGRQSYLDDELVDGIDDVTKTRRFPKQGSEVKVEETLNAVAGESDGMMVLVGGTYPDCNRLGHADPNLREPARYSSSGIDPRRPDISSISEQGRSVISGVLASGTFSGSVVSISGTSAAAPQVTRALVDFLHANGTMPPAAPYTKAELLAGILDSLGGPDSRKGRGTIEPEWATGKADRLRRRKTG